MSINDGRRRPLITRYVRPLCVLAILLAVILSLVAYHINGTNEALSIRKAVARNSDVQAVTGPIASGDVRIKKWEEYGSGDGREGRITAVASGPKGSVQVRATFAVVGGEPAHDPRIDGLRQADCFLNVVCILGSDK